MTNNQCIKLGSKIRQLVRTSLRLEGSVVTEAVRLKKNNYVCRIHVDSYDVDSLRSFLSGWYTEGIDFELKVRN